MTLRDLYEELAEGSKVSVSVAADALAADLKRIGARRVRAAPGFGKAARAFSVNSNAVDADTVDKRTRWTRCWKSMGTRG